MITLLSETSRYFGFPLLEIVQRGVCVQPAVRGTHKITAQKQDLSAENRGSCVFEPRDPF